MIGKAYNPAWAYAEAMHAAAKRWHKLGLISPEQHRAIVTDYPLDYYRPNIFIRILLFLFTLIASATVALFFGLQLLEPLGLREEASIPAICLLMAVGCFALLESTIKSSRLYRAGSDNALLYTGLTAVVALLGYLLSQVLPASHRYQFSLTDSYFLLLLLPSLALLVAATIRYADTVVAVAAYLAYLLVPTHVLLQFSAGRLLLPFVLMLAAAVAYRLLAKLARRPDYLYYKTCLTWLKALTLATFYLGGNYLVVREGNAELASLPTSVQIPFAPLFYACTALIPLVYITMGLRRPDRIWLWVGLLTMGVSCYTLRYYRSVLPPEVAATLAGALLVVLTAVAIRYLRTPRHGLTSAADEETPPLLNLESLIVAQTASVAGPPPTGFQFGGGHSGGGGATGNF